MPLGLAGTFRLCSLAHLDAAADQHGSLKFLALCSPILEYIPQDWAAAATVVSAKRLRVRNNLTISSEDSTSTNRRCDWSESELERTPTLRGGKVLVGSEAPCLYRAPEPRRLDGPPVGFCFGRLERMGVWRVGSAADRPLPPPPCSVGYLR